MLLESSFLTGFGFGLGLGNIRLGIKLPVGCLLGIIVRESETVPPDNSDGLKLGLFSRAGAGLLVKGTNKFQEGCIVGSTLEGGENRFETGFVVGLLVVG